MSTWLPMCCLIRVSASESVYFKEYESQSPCSAEDADETEGTESKRGKHRDSLKSNQTLCNQLNHCRIAKQFAITYMLQLNIRDIL